MKYFADTNIILYTIGQDNRKTELTRSLIKRELELVVSTQVINECVNVCLRKLNFTRQKAYYFADQIMSATNVVAVNEETVRKSAEIAINHQISNWDALIIASALLSDCSILYSEDMQQGQVFDNQLSIINPFV